MIEAVDAQEAVVLLGANRSIGLVFTDVTMPGPMEPQRARRLDRRALSAGQDPGRLGRHPRQRPAVHRQPYSFVELQHRIEALLAT